MIATRAKKKSWTDYLLFFRLVFHFPRSLRMTWQLLNDRRVSWKLKMLPIFPLLYFLMPVDFLPDFLPYAGYLDDLFFFFFILERFLGLLPAPLRAEYLERFRFVEPEPKEVVQMLRRLNAAGERKLHQKQEELAQIRRNLVKERKK